MSKQIIADGFSFEKPEMTAAEKERERCRVKAQRTRDKRKAAGLCRECKKPSITTSCEDCKLVRKEKRLERIRNKQCVSCTKPNENGKDQCDECCSKENARCKESLKTPDKYRRWKSSQLKHLYGITIEEYEEILAEQNYKCEICQQPIGCENKRPYVDHDHETGALRGLLCQNCNSVLGLAHDSTEVLRRAAEYIEKYKKEG